MKVALIDIETSPALSYHFGMRNIFISPQQVQERTRVLCFAVRWQEGYTPEPDGKTEFFAEWKGHDIARELFKVYDEADVVIHYNGKRFDTPHARREMIEDGLPTPSPVVELDLWQETKGRFAFMTTKLQSLAEELLQSSKLSHEGIALWIAVLAGDPEARQRMEDYNIQDVDLMVELLPLLLPWIKVPNVSLVDSAAVGPLLAADVPCPRCGRVDTLKPRGKAVTVSGVYQSYRCENDGGYVRGTRRIDGAGVVGIA